MRVARRSCSKLSSLLSLRGSVEPFRCEQLADIPHAERPSVVSIRTRANSCGASREGDHAEPEREAQARHARFQLDIPDGRSVLIETPPSGRGCSRSRGPRRPARPGGTQVDRDRAGITMTPERGKDGAEAIGALARTATVAVVHLDMGDETGREPAVDQVGERLRLCHAGRRWCPIIVRSAGLFDLPHHFRGFGDGVDERGFEPNEWSSTQKTTPRSAAHLAAAVQHSRALSHDCSLSPGTTLRCAGEPCTRTLPPRSAQRLT